MKDEFCTTGCFADPSGLNKFNSYADVLFERNVIERFPIQYLVEKMDFAMRAMIGGFSLKAPTQAIRPFDQVISCVFLFESGSGQILPDHGEWMGCLPFEIKPGLLWGDNEALLFLFVFPNLAQIKRLHFDFAKMGIDLRMRDKRI